MNYTLAEKRVLSMMKRTNFKNISKNEIVSIASDLSKLRPDVAKEIIAQFPEFATLARDTMIEYKNIIERVIESDDASLNRFYDIANQVLDDCRKMLEKPDITADEYNKIFDREMEILRLVAAKDTEKRRFNEKLTQVVTVAAIAVLSVAAGVLAGRASVKSPDSEDENAELNSTNDEE